MSEPDARQPIAGTALAPGAGSLAERPHCLIAGAGIAGLSAALFIARAGWRVTLVDREPALLEIGAGLQLAPNATRLLEPIGIMAALKSASVMPLGVTILRARDGQQIARTPLGAAAAARFGAPFAVVHRADLHAALVAQAGHEPAITLRLGLTLDDIRASEAAITALFTGDAPEQLRIPADLLVAADGLWSRGRRLAGLPAPTRYAGRTAWRALIRREAAPLFARAPEVHLWLGENAHLVHYPVSGGEQINVVAIIKDDWREEGWSAPGDPDVLAARFGGWNGRARALIAAAESWKRWALLDRAPESRWSRPRMTLMGDAAHPMLPFLAQGASQAVEDAAALASLLAPVARGEVPLAAALERYDRARIRRTARIQRQSRRQGTIYHLGGLAARARDLALGLMPDDAMLDRFAWIFAHDPREGAG